MHENVSRYIEVSLVKVHPFISHYNIDLLFPINPLKTADAFDEFTAVDY